MADKVTTQIRFICPKCQGVIGDGGMCSYECDDDALADEDRDSIIAREYEVTYRLLRESDRRLVDGNLDSYSTAYYEGEPMPTLTDKQIAELRESYESLDVRMLHALPSGVLHLLAAFPALLGMLAEKDAALLAEQKDHQLTIDTFRQQERIWDQKFDALRAELQQAKAEVADWNQRTIAALKAVEEKNARIAELEAAQPTREEFDDERISAPLTERELEQPK